MMHRHSIKLLRKLLCYFELEREAGKQHAGYTLENGPDSVSGLSHTPGLLCFSADRSGCPGLGHIRHTAETRLQHHTIAMWGSRAAWLQIKGLEIRKLPSDYVIWGSRATWLQLQGLQIRKLPSKYVISWLRLEGSDMCKVLIT